MRTIYKLPFATAGLLPTQAHAGIIITFANGQNIVFTEGDILFLIFMFVCLMIFCAIVEDIANDMSRTVDTPLEVHVHETVEDIEARTAQTRAETDHFKAQTEQNEMKMKAALREEELREAAERLREARRNRKGEGHEQRRDIPPDQKE